MVGSATQESGLVATHLKHARPTNIRPKEKRISPRKRKGKPKKPKSALKADATIITKGSEESKESGEENEDGAPDGVCYDLSSLGEDSEDSYIGNEVKGDCAYILRRRAERRAEWLKSLTPKQRRKLKLEEERDNKKHNK